MLEPTRPPFPSPAPPAVVHGLDHFSYYLILNKNSSHVMIDAVCPSQPEI